MDYGKKSLNKIHSKTWSEPLGLALTKTASHLESLHSWGIGTCFLRGPVAVGSSLLNPSITKQDLAKQNEDIEANLEQNSAVVKDVLQQKLKEIRNMMKTMQGEVLEDFQSISMEANASVKNLSDDMEYFVDELENYKRLFHMSSTLVVDEDYKIFANGVERIFKEILANSNSEVNNKDGSMEKWTSDVVRNFEKEKLENEGKFSIYLIAINQTEEKDICDPLFRYALIVQSQHLLNNAVYGIAKKDSEKVVFAFEAFNTVYDAMMKQYEQFVGVPFDPSFQCSIQNVVKKLNYTKQKFQDFDEPEMKSRLNKLFKTSEFEDITMGLILNFTKDDLQKEECFNDGKGNRLKILQLFCENPGKASIY